MYEARDCIKEDKMQQNGMGYINDSGLTHIAAQTDDATER